MRIKNPIIQNDFFPELTPLIDVMFMLLVFFMLTTTFERDTTRKSIETQLPLAKESRSITRDGAVVLMVNEKGEYFLDNTPCSADALPEVLKIRMDLTRDSVVVISGHADAPYRSLIHIYDVIQALEIKHFAHEVK